MTYQSLCNAYSFLTNNNNTQLYDFVKNFNEEYGFAWSVSPEIQIISDALDDDGHSGSSFAVVMRACQSIFNGNSVLSDYNKIN